MEKKKILIIDDEVDITAMFKLMVEKTGKYEVLTETRGDQAFSTVKQFKPDLVLLDIMMPKVDGGEVANQMKADEETKDIPIVFVTAAITKEEANTEGTLRGGYPVLAKPVPMEELINAVETYSGENKLPEKETGAPSTSAKRDFLINEKRKHLRLKTNCLFSYICMDNNGSPIGDGVGRALNISQGGVRLETYFPIQTEYIQLTTSDINEKLVNIKCKIVYSKAVEPHVFHLGVSFQEPDDKIREFVVDIVKVFSQQKWGLKNIEQSH